MQNLQTVVNTLDDYLTLKNYSKATRKSYNSALRQFLIWRINQGFDEVLTQQQAQDYILWRYSQNLKWQTINGDYSALMKYFKHIKNQDWDVDQLPRPRKERSLPRILAKEDVEKMIAYAANLKHQTFMCLLYGTGIRLGEALNLKIIDIDGKRGQLLIAKGKGAKDRYVDIPECLLLMLRHYYLSYRPTTYLFNGKVSGEQLAARSAQHLIKVASKRAGIEKKVSPHTFRHCYATHHLENGSSLVYLQQQMGHKHLKTTAKYIHVMREHLWQIHHPIVDIKLHYHSRIA